MNNWWPSKKQHALLLNREIKNNDELWGLKFPYLHWLWYWGVWKGRQWEHYDVVIAGCNPLLAMAQAASTDCNGKMAIILTRDDDFWEYQHAMDWMETGGFKTVYKAWKRELGEKQCVLYINIELEKWNEDDQCLVTSYKYDKYTNMAQWKWAFWLREACQKIVWFWDKNLTGNLKKRVFFYNHLIWTSDGINSKKAEPVTKEKCWNDLSNFIS